MKPSRRSFCFLLALLLMDSAVWAQSESESISAQRWAEGFNGFALLCRSLGLEPLNQNLSSSSIDPQDAILVVLGTNATSDREIARLRRFIRDGGAVLLATDMPGYFFRGGLVIDRPRGYMQASDAQQRFNGFRDCPIVEVFSPDHPITSGLKSVITNRTAGIELRASEWEAIATLPELSNRGREYEFAVVSKNASERLVVCADPSIFSNQMIFQGDNARFALQMMYWLKQGRRNQLIILYENRPISPEDPQSVAVDFPTPSEDEIWDAIQQLPPDLLLEFGNEIAALVEDEDLVNELLTEIMADAEDFYVMRFLILLSTFLLVGFVFYRYMTSESTLQEAVGTDWNDVGSSTRGYRTGSNSAGAHQRLMAAREMVRRFYESVSDGQGKSYRSFPKGLRLVHSDNGRAVKKEMRRVRKRLNNRQAKKWNSVSLEKLKAELDAWQHLVDEGKLIYQSVQNHESPGPNAERAANSSVT